MGSTDKDRAPSVAPRERHAEELGGLAELSLLTAAALLWHQFRGGGELAHWAAIAYAALAVLVFVARRNASIGTAGIAVSTLAAGATLLVCTDATAPGVLGCAVGAGIGAGPSAGPAKLPRVVLWIAAGGIALSAGLAFHTTAPRVGSAAYAALHYVVSALWLAFGVHHGRVIARRLSRQAAISDIARRKLERANHELDRTRQQAEVASRAKSAFLANMSHELRTPLNAIIGYSEILIEEAEDAGNAQAIADLEKIRAAGNHLVGLVSGVLDLSKIEAGKMVVSTQPFDVGDIVRDVHATLEPLARKDDNELLVEWGGGELPTSATGDATKLRQVLINLVGNACKFTENGSIRVGLDQSTADRIVIDVTDTGCGIAEDDLSALFQPFTQVDSGATRTHEGTGLGLALSRQFCRLMGGEIRVESAPGRGSTFTVDIPRHLGTTKKGNVRATPRFDPCDGERPVLVVDDDPDARETVRRAIEGDGREVREASDGNEALAALAAHGASLLFLDLQMPVMDGHELLREIDSREELKHFPVVVISGENLAPEVEARLKKRVLDIVYKASWSPRQLRAITDRHALQCDPEPARLPPTSFVSSPSASATRRIP